MDKKRKVVACEIREVDDESRSFLAVASTEDLDRDNDRIMADGWDLENFVKNPVVPWSHRYGEPPVAQATEVYVENGKLMFRPKFATKETYDFADTIFRLYKGGFLRSFSVGFMPKRYEVVDRDEKGQGKGRGYDFLEQELWEISAVTVPANPNALAAAKQKGVISEEEAAALAGPESAEAPNTLGGFEGPAAAGENEPYSEHLKRLDDILEGINALTGAVSGLVERMNNADKNPETDNPSKAKTPEPDTPDPDQEQDRLMEIVESACKSAADRIGKSVNERINYHLGKVE